MMKPKSCVILVACAFTLMLFPYLSIAADSQMQGGPLRDGNSTFVFPKPVRLFGLVGSSRIMQTVRPIPGGDPLDVFSPLGARDIVATFVNEGTDPAQVMITKEKFRYSTVVTRMIGPGEALSEEFRQVTDIQVSCPEVDSAVPNCIIRLVIVYAPPTGGVSGPDVLTWFPQTCAPPGEPAEANVPPDQLPDCLWEQDTIWSSNVSRDVNVFVEITGDHDLTVEIEFSPGGIFQSFNLAAPPALPQFRFLQEAFEDIIAVRVLCQKSPVNDCSSCQYMYQICYVQ